MNSLIETSIIIHWLNNIIMMRLSLAMKLRIQFLQLPMSHQLLIAIQKMMISQISNSLMKSCKAMLVDLIVDLEIRKISHLNLTTRNKFLDT